MDDEVDRFKDQLSRISANAYSKVTEKSAALENLASIWNDEDVRAELLVDTDNRRSLIEELGFCVRQECNDNVKKISTRGKTFRRIMFDIWKDVVIRELEDKHANIKVDSFFDTIQYLMRHNFDIWAEYERACWWDTLDLASKIITHYSLAEVPFEKSQKFLPFCVEHFEKAVKQGERKDQLRIAKLIYILVKDVRLLQFSTDILALIGHFEFLFVENFKWEAMNPTRTVVLDIVYMLFVEFSHSCRTQLLQAFAPLARQLFPLIVINEKNVGHTPGQDNDTPCFNESLFRFLEVFVTCAFPKCCIDVLDISEDVSSLIEYCAEHVKSIFDKQYSKNISFYNKSPESVIPKQRLRFVARLLVIQHNLIVNSRSCSSSPSNNSKRIRLETRLQAMISSMQPHYLVIFEEIFEKFEKLLPEEILTSIIETVARTDLSAIRRNGSMNTYVKSLAMLLRSDRLFLSDEELNALFNKALNWLHIPSVVESTCIMLKNLLIWFPIRLNSQNSLSESVLKNVCRLSRLTPGAVNLLLFVIRSYDFDECFTFRDDINDSNPDAWKFRKQLITLLLKDTEVDADFSDLLISLLFIYPNAVELEKMISYNEDEIAIVEENLSWVTKFSIDDQLPNNEIEAISTASIPELLSYLLNTFNDFFFSDTIEQTKCPQIWRVFTIFRIKTQRLNNIPMDEILQLQELFDSALLEVAEESDAEDMLLLDLGLYWEFSSDTARRAINTALPNIQQLSKFIAYWNANSVPDAFLEECIKGSRLHDSNFVKQCFLKLSGGRNFTDKIRLLRLYGKYLNQNEYSSIMSYIKNDLDNEIARADDDERVKFLMEMFSRELILSANPKNINFSSHLEFLLQNSPTELILIFLKMQSETSELLLQWFNLSTDTISKFPTQTAFFVKCLFKEVSASKILGLLLTLIEPVEKHIQFYIPNYNEIKQFAHFLTEFQNGRSFELNTQDWNEIVGRKVFPMILFELRQKTKRIFETASTNCILHLASALSTVSTVLCNLKVQEKSKQLIEILMIDLIAISKCICVKLFEFKPSDDSGLSDLICEWLNAVNCVVRLQNADWIGFVALDLLHENCENFPKLWDNVMNTRLPFVMKYNMVLLNPTVAECPESFETAYDAFQKGLLDCVTFPVIKSQIFWRWLNVRLNNIEVKKKSVAQLRRLWIFCPWLRSELTQILCLFSENTLRDKQCKVLSGFLESDDISNIKFMASLLLFDYVELVGEDVTRALYHSIFQFHPEVVSPKIDEFDLSYLPDDDNLLSFLVECLMTKEFCFKELQPFLVVGFNKIIFGILSSMLMWRRLEEAEVDTAIIFKKLDPLIKSLDRKECLQDFEILFMSAVAEVLTYKSIVKLELPFIRCLLKAGLLEEAFYYFKYYIDFTELPGRKTFHIRSSDRSSLIRWVNPTEADSVADVFTKIVVATKDDVLSAALPLANQYEDEVRSFVAELRFDWGIAASLYEQLNQPMDASNALYHLSHKTFDLANKDNYRRVIELSQWPAVESSTLSHPKSVDEHNATLYSLFHLTCRKQSYNLGTIWKDRLKEIKIVNVVYSNLLDECRDLKLLECLNLMKSCPETKLPEDPDLGIASAFLLAGWKKPSGETAENVFDSFFERIQKITLERIRELRQKKSFQRAQSLLKVLEDIAVQYEEYRGNSAWLEKARLLLANQERNAAKFMLEKVVKNMGIPDSTNQFEIFERSASQAQALVMAAEMSDQTQKADRHFFKALEVATNIEQDDSHYVYECSLKYAYFAFKRYKELDDHTKSQHFLLQVEATEQLAKDIRRVSTHEDKNRRQKELEAEKEDVLHIRSERNKFLNISAKNFMRALSLKTENELIIPYLTSMIIQNVDNRELMTMIMEQLKTVPVHVWLPVQEVLTSYLFSDKAISLLVKSIICQLLNAHPYHSVYPMYFHSSAVKVPDMVSHNKRKAIITAILASCKNKNPKLNEALKNTKATYDMLKDFGDARIDDISKFEHREGSTFIIRKNAFKLQKELKTLKMAPIPICDQPINEPNDFSTTNMIRFEEVISEVIKAGGLSAPKILEVRGSDGNMYKLIFKPEDLRCDGLVQLIFQLSNIIIKGAAFRSQLLRSLKTYRVVPIDRALGIIECCMGTVSLNDYLVGPGRSGGAHQILRPDDLHVGVAHRRFGNRSNGTQSLLDSFMSCCNEISPVFRYFFYENFVQPHRFNKYIRYYTDSLAMWSIVCYVVGLGDRHLNNILIDKETGELIHIDLGMLFEYTKRVLPIPEKVPFRLTRDLVDPILVEGINSRFKHVAVHTLEQLRQNDQVIIGIASLLLHDPISAFGGETKMDGTERNMLAETAISRLRLKLEGRDLSVVSQDAEQQVSQLINDARNAKNLSQMYAGWMPFI